MPPKAMPDSQDQDLSAYSLHSEAQTTGRFWLPSDPSTRWWGQTRRFPGGRSLTQLYEWVDSRTPERRTVPAIHGELATGLICSLLDGDVVNPVPQSGNALALLEDPIIVYGAHIEDSDVPALRHMRVKFSHVNEWFGRPYSLEHVENLKTFTIDYTPSELSVRFDYRGTSVALDLFCERVIPGIIDPRGGAWPYWYRFDLVPEKPESLKWFLDAASLLRQCLMLLIGKPVYTVEIEPGFSDEPLQPYEKLVILPVNTDQRIRVEPYWFSSSYSDLVEVLPGIIQTWFHEPDRYAPIADTFQEVLLGRGGNMNALFLRIVQALERLHSIALPTNGECVPSPVWRSISAELRARLEQIEVPDLPDWEDARRYLGKRLLTLNSIGLQARVRHLLDSVPRHLLMPILFNPSDPGAELEEFPRQVAKARNELSHGRQCTLPDSRRLARLLRSCWGLYNYAAAHLVGVPPPIAGAMALKASRLTRQVDHGSRL